MFKCVEVHNVSLGIENYEYDFIEQFKYVAGDMITLEISSKMSLLFNM